MKEERIKNFGPTIQNVGITSAIPPPMPKARRGSEYKSPEVARLVTGADPVGNAVASAAVYCAMLYTRCKAPLRLSDELRLVLTHLDCAQGKEDHHDR